jgi:hypothetical protein
MKRCPWHSGDVPDDQAVPVARRQPHLNVEGLVYACRPCIARVNLLPLGEHPAGSDGRLSFRTSQRTGRTPA